jgi:hypothetical protein
MRQKRDPLTRGNVLLLKGIGVGCAGAAFLANDAELLAMVLGPRADQITATTRAALDASEVIKRAQKNGG